MKTPPVVLDLVEILKKHSATLSVAESCTGGGLGAIISQVPGVSRIFKGGVIAYRNEIKHKVLGVSSGLLKKEDVVSEPIALEMAQKIKALFRSDYALSITGQAGPTHGDSKTPIGTICIGVIGPHFAEALTYRWKPPSPLLDLGDQTRKSASSRIRIQKWAVQKACRLLLKKILEAAPDQHTHRGATPYRGLHRKGLSKLVG